MSGDNRDPYGGQRQRRAVSTLQDLEKRVRRGRRMVFVNPHKYMADKKNADNYMVGAIVGDLLGAAPGLELAIASGQQIRG